MDEADLIRRAALNDLEAWEPLVQMHQEAVFRLAYLIVGDADEAEDVAQETFIRAYRSLNRFDTARPLRPWLLSIAGNLSRNRLRSLGRYLNTLQRLVRFDEPRPPNPEEQASSSWESEMLWRAIRQLEANDQQVIYLRYFLDLPVEEAAQALGVASGTVKSRLHRAAARLRTIVERDFPALVEERLM